MILKGLEPRIIEENEQWQNHFQKKYGFIFFKPNFSLVPNVSTYMDNKELETKIVKLEYYLLGTQSIFMGTNNHKEMHDLRYNFSKEEYV